ncbi:MAG: FecR domain-containing protein [Bacteroidales bacterium]|nr:FecR domain-containing protein [Bacteroidales bacterium]MCF8390875.1 FecR domain-containing protein [Bacteroidales bacterium]
MKKEKDIWTLSANYLSGEMTTDERTEFIQFIAKNPDFKSEFEKIKLSWNNLRPENLPESKKSWVKLKLRLESDGLLDAPVRRTISLNYYFMRVAAAIIVIGLIVGITMRYFSPGENYSFLRSTTLTATENVNSYYLPDGSNVFLKKGSKLSYADNFGGNRKIKLKGEGYFEVMSDPKYPFIIETRNAVISVLGTKFNVKENHNITEVLVESGKVQLKTDENSEGIIMTKGDFGISDGRTESLGLNSNINYLSWKTREFKFSDLSLNEAILVLEDSYHVKINILDESINDLRISSSYSQQSIDAIIQTICVAFDLSCEHSENEYSLKRNN